MSLSQGLARPLRVRLHPSVYPRLGGELSLLLYPQAVYPQPLLPFLQRQREVRLPLLDQAATLLQALPLPRGQGVPLSQGLVRPLRVLLLLSVYPRLGGELALLLYPQAGYPLQLPLFPLRQQEVRQQLLDRVAILLQGLPLARGQWALLFQGLVRPLRVRLHLSASLDVVQEAVLLQYPQAVYPLKLPLFLQHQREARLQLLDQAATLLQALPLPRGQQVVIIQYLVLPLRVRLHLSASLDVVQEAVLLQYPQAGYPQPLPLFILRQREARVGLLGQHKQLFHLVLLLHGVDKLSQGRHREP